MPFSLAKRQVLGLQPPWQEPEEEEERRSTWALELEELC